MGYRARCSAAESFRLANFYRTSSLEEGEMSFGLSLLLVRRFMGA